VCVKATSPAGPPISADAGGTPSLLGDALLGQTLSHYRITEKIGAGGMGDVYRAHDEHLDREVAIKVLRPGTLTDERSRKQFHKEAMALSRLNHPNIATIFDFDTQQDIDFLVMEYIPGVSLGEKLTAGPLPEKEVVRLGILLAEGLVAAHEHGVVHRDMKPGNVRLSDSGGVKILDFGLAKLWKPTSDSSSTESNLDRWAISGTLAYMAPEQVCGEEIDGRTDIHATGLVLYEMTTGRPPFADVEISQLIGAILHRQPPPPSTLNPRLSPELVRIIGKCLEKEPENRYQSAKELGVDLRRLAHAADTGVSRTEASMEQTRRLMWPQRSLLALGTAVILILVVVAGVWWRRSMRESAQPAITASIAVLPFADLSAAHDQEYFSDGLAEEILNDLAKIPNLKVVARTSAFQFKAKNEDVRVIKQKLNVDNVLEGSVRREGARVRITAQLIKADDGFDLWSESYDRDLKDVLTMQDEIAKAVTSALKLRLLGGKTSTTAQTSRTTSPEAYQDFLQARYFEGRGDKGSQEKAMDYVNGAIQADPRYAAAYALRASLTVNSGAAGWTDYREAMEKGRRDVDKAIGLDPSLADGYRALSRIQALAELKCSAAEATLKRALDLAPGDAENLSWGAFLANCLGHEEEAVELVRKAGALDPLVAGQYRLLGQYLRNLGDYEQAQAALGKALDLNPHEVWIHETRGEVYLAQGRPQEALAEMEQETLTCFHDLGMALAYHALGKNRESDAALAGLVAQYGNSCAYQIAEAYAYRGEADRAFEWLSRAYRQHDGGLCLAKTDLLLKSLRDDPRYLTMLKSIILQ